MTIEFDGRAGARPSRARPSARRAVAGGHPLVADDPPGRRTRGLFCGIGACFDCLATIDGVPGQRACLAPARPGVVSRTVGVPDAPAAPRPASEGPRRCVRPPRRRLRRTPQDV